MVGTNVNLPEEENTPEKRVERIFTLMDKVGGKYFLISRLNCCPGTPIFRDPEPKTFSGLDDPGR